MSSRLITAAVAAILAIPAIAWAAPLPKPLIGTAETGLAAPAAVVVVRGPTPTTYSFVAQRSTVADFAPFLLGWSGSGDPSPQLRLHEPGGITYSMVESPAPRRGMDPLPAAAFMLTLILSGLVALAWWWQHRRWL
jgi:hypothetical protein